MMHLIQILLPIYDNDGQPLPKELFQEVRGELAEQFGGVTVYSRAPAEGLWQEKESQPVKKDDLLLFEVMTDALDRNWWKEYGESLEQRFRQEEIVIRAQEMTLL